MTIRPRSFAHVVYRTYRFDQMLDWYEGVWRQVDNEGQGLSITVLRSLPR